VKSDVRTQEIGCSLVSAMVLAVVLLAAAVVVAVELNADRCQLVPINPLVEAE